MSTVLAPAREIRTVDDTVEAQASADHAFSAFYTANYDGVARALAVTLGNSEFAAEATDEAMARAYSNWSAVRNYDNPPGWVYRVALNWANSFLRRASRRPKPEPVGVASAADTVVNDLVLAAAVAELDIKMRSVVVCRYLLDWTVEDTAAALGLRPGTVKSRLSRALTLLQQRLGSQEGAA